MAKEIRGKCWKCGKMNSPQRGGYFYCDCSDLWYLPTEVWKERREQRRLENLPKVPLNN